MVRCHGNSLRRYNWETCWVPSLDLELTVCQVSGYNITIYPYLIMYNKYEKCQPSEIDVIPLCVRPRIETPVWVCLCHWLGVSDDGDARPTDGWRNCFACCFFVPRTEQHPRNWIAYKRHNPASPYSLQTVCCRFIKKWNETQPQPDVNSRSIMPGWAGESDDAWTQHPISAIAASSIHDSLKINRRWRQRSRLAEVIHFINLSKISSQCSIKHLCFHWNLYSFLIRPGD